MIILCPLVAVVAALCIAKTFSDPDLKGLAVLCAIIAGLWLIYSIVSYIISDLMITSRRLIIHSGLVGWSSLEIPLFQVEKISIRQGLVGEILGYGSITVRSSVGREECVHGVAAPVELKKKALGQMFAMVNSRPEDEDNA